MSARTSVHEVRSMSAKCSDDAYWLTIEAEGGCDAVIFFDSPSEMVRMLRAGLGSAMQLERESKGGK